MSNPFAVIGAGNGGLAIAAHIKSMGGEVRLYDIFPEVLTPIKKSGHINLTYMDIEEQVELNLVTEDIGEAITGAKTILIVTPAFTHKMIAEKCEPFLEDGQIIVLNPGRTAGAIEFLSKIRELGCKKNIVVSETQTLIYSCRKTNGDSVTIYGLKKSVDIASIPSNKVMEVISELSSYYPQFKPVKNTLITSLSNIGSLFHPIPVLLNIGRIETDERGFKYYWEGISPSVSELIEIVDSERLQVAKALGLDILSVKEWLVESYDTYGDTLHQLIGNNKAYEDILAPNTINTRYVTEDVPTGLVPISEFGKKLGVPTPNIDALILLASSIFKIDFRANGRSLENLGIKDYSKDRIIRYIENGEVN